MIYLGDLRKVTQHSTGQAFIDAKGSVGHGNFEKLFASHKQHVREPVNCSTSTARMLMAIARNAELLNEKHGSFFRTSYRKLYELTRINPSELKVILNRLEKCNH